jgi:hypothetical protein
MPTVAARLKSAATRRWAVATRRTSYGWQAKLSEPSEASTQILLATDRKTDIHFAGLQLQFLRALLRSIPRS